MERLFSLIRRMKTDHTTQPHGQASAPRDDANWHGEGDTPDDLSGLIVVRDLGD
jgi:hypothetical protein